MRVKKPTSKRTTTRMREGIKKKAAAQQRKNRKNAKKDITWKSRSKKDPGIPANFPYKDKIVSELEESRRVEKEKKEQAKLQRQQEREEALARGDMVDDLMDEDEENDNHGGLAALLESAEQAAKAYNGENGQDDDDMDDNMDDSDEDVEFELSDVDEADLHKDIDTSRRAYDKIFKAVVEASDVVLYVLDARDPQSTRSKKVEQAVLQNPGKRLILLLNKVDLIPTDVLTQWLNVLKSSFPTIPIKAAPGATNSQSFNKNLTSTFTANSLMQALKSFSAKSNLKRSIVVGVIGYPNVGKSSIINALTNRHGNHSKACPVGNMAGVTTSMREVKIDNKLKILDSPGIVFPDEVLSKKSSKTSQEAKLALLSAIPPKQITDATPAVQLLLKKLSQNDEMAQGLKTYYEMPAIHSSNLEEFTKQFLIHVARSRGRLGRGGIPNLDSAARSVLNDWRDGRIIGWTLPKASKAAVVEDIDGPKSSLRGEKEPPKVEQTTVVSEWAKEFDLGDLLGSNFGLN